jgi:NhaA family Na+:H+ antiporter
MKPQELPEAQTPLTPLVRPLQRFLSTESASGIVLIAAAALALAIANSPWAHAYHSFWHTKLSIGAGDYAHAMSLEHWVNDGLMVIFFLLVGLEIKRELLIGELRSFSRSALPVAAAIGGMLVPALIYTAFNHGREGSSGWGVPMATDIAFAAGVLALVGRGIPTSVKVLLLAIAIVDDLGAVVVIALFYTSKINTTALALAGLFFLALAMLNLLRVHRPTPYLLLGVGLWAATLASGIHATIAGVLLAFTIPATRLLEERPYLTHARSLLDAFEKETLVTPDKITEEQSHALISLEHASKVVQTPLARVEHALLKPVAFLIVPLFAFANAGVSLGLGGTDNSAEATQAVHAAGSTWVFLGTFLGLVLGKPLGVLLACLLVVKLKIASLPAGATLRQITAVATLCGIGFTMSLFVANLAFPPELPTSQPLLNAAKIAILAASLGAGLAGAIILLTARKTLPTA